MGKTFKDLRGRMSADKDFVRINGGKFRKTYNNVERSKERDPASAEDRFTTFTVSKYHRVS